MSINQQIILDTILEQQRAIVYPNLSTDEFFHSFVTEQILKNYELSYEEIEAGVVDGGNDGGIDGIYLFVNSELVQPDTELLEGKKNVVIDVYLIQSKSTTSFSGSSIEKCTSSASDLFDLSKSIAELRSVYNNELLSNIKLFRDQYLHLASKFPNLRFHYYYATKGIDIHPNVARKVGHLRKAIQSHFDKAEVNFTFLAAHDLIRLSRKEQLKSKEIVVTDNPISTQDGSYVAIVPLKAYYDFITDEGGQLIKYFFDANIRDYQGAVEVNHAIKDTLHFEDLDDFWWLNNGITITASDASFASKRLHIQDPQVVNGLQTSFEIFNYFHTKNIREDKRNLLIRVIKAGSERSRLKVIKATNSQTKIPPASLRATDSIHRDIEDFLLAKGFYYDRRKNYHKNQGRPVRKIVSISYLAQIIMSILKQQPNYARARPSTLIKSATDYADIFNESLPINLYYKAIVIQQTVENALKQYRHKMLTRPQIGDIRFYVAMYVVARLTGKLNCNASDIAKLDVSVIDAGVVEDAILNVYNIYQEMGGNDAVAKGKDFVETLLRKLKKMRTKLLLVN